MAEGLKPYRGALTAAKIAEGMNAAQKNAQSLAEEARILFDSGKFARSTALAILSIEEKGKLAILRDLSTATTELEAKRAWKRYRSHRSKNTHWITIELVQAGAKEMEDFRPMIDENADHTKMLDNLKQVAFYTDCLGESHWSIPNDVIAESTAASILKTAEVLSTGGMHSEVGIELWKKHIGPVRDKSLPEQKIALKSWHSEMLSKGLVKKGAIDFDGFVGV